jgi:hypothetical protein
MAETAVEPKITDMMLVAEWDWLLQRYSDVGPVRRSIEQIESVSSSHQKQRYGQDKKLGV